MKKLFPYLTEQLREALISLIWDQWVALGSGGGGKVSKVPFAIDPESLLLISTQFCADEPRLRDICMDWLAENGRLIHLQRLKNIQGRSSLADIRELSELASRMANSGHGNWKTLAQLDSIVREDPLPLGKSRSSRSPDPFAGEAFICRMRNFFGMNARAEVFFWLQTHPFGHAAEIARDCHWLPKTVQLILGELEQAGMVSLREKGRQKIYSLMKKDSWGFFSDPETPLVWFSQVPFYTGCRELLQLLMTLCEKEKEGDEVKMILIERKRKLIAEAFALSGMKPIFADWKEESRRENVFDYFENEVLRLTQIVVVERSLPNQFSFP